MCDKNLASVSPANVEDGKKEKENSTMTKEGLEQNFLAAQDALKQQYHEARSALDNREARLEERELALQRAVEAFEVEKQLLAGKTPGDILELNVGGTKIMVKRSTLCQCEDSLLAAHFSGRWDDNVEKVGEAFFIDQPPELFVGLVDFLRAKDIETPSWPARLPIALEQSFNFRGLLEYYGMMSFVFSGTYVWKFQRLSFAAEMVEGKMHFSDAFILAGREWRLGFQPRTLPNSVTGTKHVGLHLFPIGGGFPRTASITMTMRGSKRNVTKVCRNKKFAGLGDTVGSTDFMEFDEVFDVNAGFLDEDGALTVQVTAELHPIDW